MKDSIVPETYLRQFTQTLNSFCAHSDEVLAYFADHLEHISLERGRMLLHAGHVCNHYYFICKGAVRGYFHEGRHEATTWISVDGEMVTSISSLDLAQPAFENMQAIEDCHLLAMSSDALTRLYALFPSFNETGRLLLQQYYRDAEMRAYISRLKNAETKYRHFLSRYGHLANRIQLQYISSFLGISLETLSRVRKKLSHVKPDMDR